MSNLQNSLNKALQLHQSGRVQEAINLYERLIANHESNAQLDFLLGTGYLQIGKNEQGILFLSRVLEQYPDHTDVLTNRGIALKKLGRYEEAIASFDKVISINPNLAEAYNNRGNALQKQYRHNEAVQNYDRAIELKADYADAYYNRGTICLEFKLLKEALNDYTKAHNLDPDIPFLLGVILHIQMRLCDWSLLPNALNMLLTQASQSKPVTNPFDALALIDDPKLHLKISRIYADAEFKKQEALGPIAKRASDGKIRIGYYSNDFCNHAVSLLMAELFALHDRSKFDVYGFSFGTESNDEMRQQLSAAFDKFIDVRGKGDREVAKLSRELNIDIAVDLGGYTRGSRPGIFAERAAPIQVCYLGYIGTMGAEYIDYVIADKTVIPTESQSNFAEKVAYLPHSYQVNVSNRTISDRQFTKQELGLPETGFVFCCFNDNYKILPATFDGWMRILKAVEGSVLWLFEGSPTAAANLRTEAERRGVNSSRLVFAQRISNKDYLARSRLADLMLDTLPYNAGTVASDALWVGLPVLTCMGKSFVSRMAASLLTAIDLPELITHTQKGYEAKAIELATHPNKLREIKNKLEHNRLTTPLFDTKLFAQHIEAAYEAMYSRYQADLQPDVIEVTHS